MGLNEQLGLFLYRADELANTRLLRDDGLSVNLNINFHHLRGLSFASQEPDEDLLRSFLLSFRHFISPKEPVYLHQIYNLCMQHIRSDELKGCLVEARDAWRQLHRNAGFRLVVDDKAMTPEHVTDLWINGYYFHNDPKKMSELQGLVPHARVLVRHEFLNFLIEATRQVQYVAHIVRVARKEGLLG